jgi:hypothetical protein
MRVELERPEHDLVHGFERAGVDGAAAGHVSAEIGADFGFDVHHAISFMASRIRSARACASSVWLLGT